MARSYTILKPCPITMKYGNLLSELLDATPDKLLSSVTAGKDPSLSTVNKPKPQHTYLTSGSILLVNPPKGRL